jgi:hypothetical protein
MMSIDTGDTVFHAPSGERWVVALVSGTRLSWCGWPEGTADLKDCTLIDKATPEERLELLNEMAAMGEPDHRGQYARRLLTGER